MLFVLTWIWLKIGWRGRLWRGFQLEPITSRHASRTYFRGGTAGENDIWLWYMHLILGFGRSVYVKSLMKIFYRVLDINHAFLVFTQSWKLFQFLNKSKIKLFHKNKKIKIYLKRYENNYFDSFMHQCFFVFCFFLTKSTNHFFYIYHVW